ncbi:MAG TPA: 50S ribosomal protein L20 [Candidatus Kapabacteria bacterium]|nr:50S ribosomal protein L20 [Candidatus Kapabacteria bacterium]
MPRAKNLPAARHRKKKILKAAKGFFGMRSNVYTVAAHHVDKARLYAYRDRRNRKREFRELWIVRINAGARANGTTYSRLIGGLAKSGIMINRKLLADLAVRNPDAFAAIVKAAK